MTKEESELKYKLLTERTQGNFKAFLYDCDGTLADNMDAHKETYQRVASGAGVDIHTAIIDEFAGLPIVSVVAEINKRYNANFDAIAFEAAKYKLYYEEYINKILPIAYVVDHLKAHAGKVKIGVVSGGSRQSIEKTLAVLGIDHLVEVMVCAGETRRGKPYPDPFLQAAQLLGVEPETCMVFEDGNAGVQAAGSAGMQWVRIDQL